MDRGTTLLACRNEAPTTLDTAYDRYAVGLFDYCRWALGEERNAADAVADALLTAAARDLIPAEAGAAAGRRAEPRLRGAASRSVDSEPLRAWLFAVARNECLRRSEHVMTGIAGGGSRYSDLDYPIPQLTLDERTHLAQLRRALDQLDPFEQELAELAFRHGFTPAALAAIVGRTLPRIRTAMAHVYAHLAAACPTGVGMAFAISPFAHPPASLRRLLLEGAAVPPRLRHLATRHAPYDRYGFPRLFGRARRRTGRRGAVALVVAVAVGLGVAATNLTAPRAETPPRTPAAAAKPSAQPRPDTPPTPSPTAAAIPPPTTAPPVSMAPRRRTQAPTPRPLSAPPPPVQSLTTSIQFTYDITNRTWGAVVTSTVRGVSPTAVQIRLWWEDVDGKHYRKPTTTRSGQYTYTAALLGMRHGPVACAKATVTLASGKRIDTPVAGPAGSQYCGSPSLGASPSPTPKAR